MAFVAGKRRTVDFLGLLMDEEVLRSLMASRLRPRIDPTVDPEYPWVFDLKGKRIIALHHWVWNYFVYRRLVRKLKEGEIVHHRNGRKNDARISNLGPGDRATHAKLHLSKRQNFVPRKRQDLGGLYRPHAPAPIRVIPREEVSYTPPVKTKMPLVAGDTISSDALAEAEEKLDALLPELHAEMAHLDSGRRIPKKKQVGGWRDARTRAMGFIEPRLGCKNAERALVFLLVKNKFDISAVATEAKIPASAIRTMQHRPSVSVAIERWLQYRRLPLKAALPRRNGRLAEKI